MYQLQSVVVKENLLKEFIEAIRQNKSLSVIQDWSCWENNYHYLMYRYHPKIMSELILLKKPARDRLSKLESWKRVVQYCDECLKTDVTLTIKGVAQAVEVTSNTLSKWGYSRYITEKKEKQSVHRIDQKKREWFKTVEEYKQHSVVKRRI